MNDEVENFCYNPQDFEPEIKTAFLAGVEAARTFREPLTAEDLWLYFAVGDE